jgi:hypothetical protein
VLHTWGSSLTHHPHVHGIVPGGGLSPDGERWVACRPGFFLPVRVLSRLFRRRFLEQLAAVHRRGELRFFSDYAALADPAVFAQWLAPLRACEWVVYAKRPFAGPEAVLAFRWKDYRAKGRTRYKTMTLGADEFMRRFLLHVLPRGFHRIRHYGLLANPVRRQNLAKVRGLLHVVPAASTQPDDTGPAVHPAFICRHCGAPMIVIEVLQRSPPIRAPPAQRAAA